jgi:hypothetical protein
MNAGVWLRKVFWLMAFAAALVVCVWIDWLPTLKDLNRLKRAQREYVLQTDRLNSAFSHFSFPDEKEKLVFANNADRLVKLMPAVVDDASWLAMIVSALADRAKLDHLDSAMLLTLDSSGQPFEVPFKLSNRAADDLQHWLQGLRREYERDLHVCVDRLYFPWRDALGLQGQLACRPIVIAVAAKLPALLSFVNHCTWSAGRLEIVRLRMGQGDGRPLALILCRGFYQVRSQSPWRLQAEVGKNGKNQLIDADSTLLWQPVNPQAVGLAAKKELPPMPGQGLFMHKGN